MNSNSILSNFRGTFSQAWKKNQYIESLDGEKRFKIGKKDIRLNEVFKKGQEFLTQDLKAGKTKEELTAQITDLTAIEQDSELLYKNYLEKTNTRRRRILKFINYYSPRLLKYFFPRVFSNGCEEAEINTKNEYEAFKKYLSKLRDDFKIEKNKVILSTNTPNPQPKKPVDEVEEEPFTIIITPPPVIEEEEKVENFQHLSLEVVTKELLTQLEKNVVSFKNSLTYQDFLMNFDLLERDFNRLFRLYPNHSEFLDLTKNIPDKFPSIFLHSFLHFVEKDEIISLTPCAEAYNSVKKQHIEVELIVRTLKEKVGFRAKTSGGEKPDTYFNNFENHLIVDSKFVGYISQFLASKKGCKPSYIEIRFKKEESMNEDSLREIFKFAENYEIIPHPGNFATFEGHQSGSKIDRVWYKITGAEVLNLQKLNAPEIKKLLNLLPKIQCPDLLLINFPKIKDVLSPDELGSFLKFLPSQHLLKQFYEICPTPHLIPLPCTLLSLNRLDLEEVFSFEQINYLLRQFPKLEVVDLGRPDLTEAQLKKWVRKGLLNHVKDLDLRSANLTTDVLFTLAEMKNLTKFRISELSEGEKDLSELPKLSDPLKIVEFYNRSALTRPFARQLYNGPLKWVTALQIPLARYKEKNLFSEEDKVLDPYSVALWLQENDYLLLDPQECVESIFADCCAKLNDSNIVNFFKKFPKTTFVSLKNCPHLTEKGIQQLKELLPEAKIEFSLDDITLKVKDANDLLGEKIENYKRIDLEGCENLTDSILKNLLDRLRADNPERVELNYLSLKGCVQITDEAFYETEDQTYIYKTIKLIKDHETSQYYYKKTYELPPKKAPLIFSPSLELVLNETRISDNLKGLYRLNTYRSLDADPEVALIAHNRAGKKFQMGLELEPMETELFMYNRIIIYVFGHLCKDTYEVELAMRMPIIS